ncbi:hypothetical protein TIFTF001_030279 [Ficus carica]|uniref:Uncharacterized protein n=1 Tax=Ficus carica TaxID=3494 RepID=A0AA88DTA5_FICCA|nr:hypothetical protein TIFTF001_030279 [Ficus carica]
MDVRCQGQYEADNPGRGSVVVGEVLPRPILQSLIVICSGPWRKANLKASSTSEVVVDQPGARGRILHNWFVWSGRLYTGHRLFSIDRENRPVPGLFPLPFFFRFDYILNVKRKTAPIFLPIFRGEENKIAAGKREAKPLDKKMSWKGKAWAVAGTVAAMEELKDKRLCRLECSSLSSLRHPHNVEDNLETLSTQKERSSNENVETQRKGKKQNLKQTEESLRIIMYLSCWGPN